MNLCVSQNKDGVDHQWEFQYFIHPDVIINSYPVLLFSETNNGFYKQNAVLSISLLISLNQIQFELWLKEIKLLILANQQYSL